MGCTRMLSICMHDACVCSAYAYRVHSYARHTHTECMRIFSMPMHCVSVCSVYACQHQNTLSISLHFFDWKSPKTLWKMLHFKKFFGSLLMGLKWSKINYLFGPCYQKISVYAYAEHMHAHAFYPDSLSMSNNNILVEKYPSWTSSLYIFEWRKKTCFQKTHAWAPLRKRSLLHEIWRLCLVTLCILAFSKVNLSIYRLLFEHDEKCESYNTILDGFEWANKPFHATVPLHG